MTSSESDLTTDETKHPLHALVSTRPAAIIVFVYLVLFFLSSVSIFLIRFRVQSELGSPSADSLGGMLSVFIPLFKGLGAILLALDLRLYLNSLSAIERKESDAQEKLIKAIRSWWMTLSVIAVFLIALLVWSYFPLLQDYTSRRYR